jgi:hypothetical protein
MHVPTMPEDGNVSCEQLLAPPPLAPLLKESKMLSIVTPELPSDVATLRPRKLLTCISHTPTVEGEILKAKI